MMKMIRMFLLLLTSYAVQAREDSAEQLPCMDMTHSVEVIACMIDLVESKKAEYDKEYHLYTKAIMTPEERPYDKKHIYMLAKEAKKCWDIYSEKECLAEASVYEEGHYRYNVTYNLCLADRYAARIAYYKSEKNEY